MNYLFCLLVLTSFSAFAQDQAVAPEPPVAQTADSGSRPKWIANFRLGPLLTPLDPEVDKVHWDHDTESSWGASTGFYIKGYPRWREVHFFIGPDVGYLTSEESRGRAKIESSMWHLSVMAGAAYQPKWLGGNFGVHIAPSYTLWSDIKSNLSTASLNVKLNDESKKFQTSWQFAVFYQIHSQWQALITLDNRGGSFGRSQQLNLGANYAF